MLKGLGILIGHHCAQVSQNVHSAVTYLAFLLTVTVKSPIEPLKSITSVKVRRLMFGFSATSFILGVKIHAAQSFVGKTLLKRAILPPIEASRSIKVTL